MATGDQQDMLTRIKSTLPYWFGFADTPVLDALLKGPASVLSWFYSLYLYAKLQTRINTATDGWLDMISADFFGTDLIRAAGQSDDSYRALIIANLFRIKATRAAVVKVCQDTTGRTPTIIEPFNPVDCGAYGARGGYGYGAYGSIMMPAQAFVTEFRPTGPTSLQDSDLYGAINAVKPAGSIMWTQLSN